jgi:tetratricopeptide (TPR) repeat protein
MVLNAKNAAQRGTAMNLSAVTRLSLLGASALVGLALIVDPVWADMKDDPFPVPAPATGKKVPDKKAGDNKAGDKKTTTTPAPAKPNEKKSGQEFLDGYKVAYDLIQSGKYEAGIEAMHALGQDTHADVATSIGYAWRKLGDYDASKLWYDKALAADPKHTVTLSYYGMWYAEQGNVLKAEDFLQKIRVACGGIECEPYKNLRGVLEGKFTY